MIISATLIQNTLDRIELASMKRFGVDAAQRDLDPLKWYIFTGRAPSEFIRRLAKARPIIVARRLHTAGTYNEAIERVKKLIGFDG